jgi:hypothetical protein
VPPRVRTGSSQATAPCTLTVREHGGRIVRGPLTVIAQRSGISHMTVTRYSGCQRTGARNRLTKGVEDASMRRLARWLQPHAGGADARGGESNRR